MKTMGLVVVLGSALCLSGSNPNIDRSVKEKDGIIEIVEKSNDETNGTRIEKHIVIKKEGYYISHDQYPEKHGYIMRTYEYTAKTNNSIVAEAKYLQWDLDGMM